MKTNFRQQIPFVGPNGKLIELILQEYHNKNWRKIVELCEDSKSFLVLSYRAEAFFKLEEEFSGLDIVFSINSQLNTSEDHSDENMLGIAKSLVLNNIYHNKNDDSCFLKAKEIFSYYAMLGNAFACSYVAKLHAKGYGCKKDLKVAFIYHEKAANMGYLPSMFKLGNYYDYGLGVKIDNSKALHWYTETAKYDYAQSLCNLGLIHSHGIGGVCRDKTKAFEFYERAANLGSPSALFNCARYYMKGKVVSQDHKRALELFQASASKSYPKALLALGFIYYDGTLQNEVDLHRAKSYFRKAVIVDYSLMFQVPCAFLNVELYLSAIEANPKAFKLINRQFSETREFVLWAVHRNRKVFKYLPSKFQLDCDVYMLYNGMYLRLKQGNHELHPLKDMNFRFI